VQQRFLAGERLVEIVRQTGVGRTTINTWAKQGGWHQAQVKVHMLSAQKLEQTVSDRLAEMDKSHLELLAGLRAAVFVSLFERDAKGDVNLKKPLPLKGDAARAIDRIVSLERLIAGQPTDRHDVTGIGGLPKAEQLKAVREMRDLLEDALAGLQPDETADA